MEEIFFQNQRIYESCLADIGFAWEDASASEPNEYLYFSGMVMFYLGNLLEVDLWSQIEENHEDDVNQKLLDWFGPYTS